MMELKHLKINGNIWAIENISGYYIRFLYSKAIALEMFVNLSEVARSDTCSLFTPAADGVMYENNYSGSYFHLCVLPSLKIVYIISISGRYSGAFPNMRTYTLLDCDAISARECSQ